MRIDPKVSRSKIIWTRGSGDWEHGQVEFEPRWLFRIYAGQVDPADPSHFTIAYEREAARGTIDGYLREDDRVEFVPRTGAIVDRDPHGREIVWDPDVAPATRP